MELIDTHAHLTFPELETQADAVVERSIAADVTAWVTIGTEPDQNERVMALVPRFENMYAGLGFHPHHANEITAADLETLKEYAKNEKVVAIGETGLDYHYDNAVPEKQQELFRTLLSIAEGFDKPVIIHTRDAFEDTMAILDEFTGRLKNVVVHCFSGTKQQAELILSKGFHISFTGIVTFKRSEELREVAKIVPLDRMMIETDCPFISPEPVRNQRPCEPAMLVHTAKKIAEQHSLSLEDFAAKITKTSKDFFGLP